MYVVIATHGYRNCLEIEYHAVERISTLKREPACKIEETSIKSKTKQSYTFIPALAGASFDSSFLVSDDLTKKNRHD